MFLSTSLNLLSVHNTSWPPTLHRALVTDSSHCADMYHCHVSVEGENTDE